MAIIATTDIKIRFVSADLDNGFITLSFDDQEATFGIDDDGQAETSDLSDRETIRDAIAGPEYDANDPQNTRCYDIVLSRGLLYAEACYDALTHQ